MRRECTGTHVGDTIAPVWPFPHLFMCTLNAVLIHRFAWGAHRPQNSEIAFIVNEFMKQTENKRNNWRNQHRKWLLAVTSISNRRRRRQTNIINFEIPIKSNNMYFYLASLDCVYLSVDEEPTSTTTTTTTKNHGFAGCGNTLKNLWTNPLINKYGRWRSSYTGLACCPHNYSAMASFFLLGGANNENVTI